MGSLSQVRPNVTPGHLVVLGFLLVARLVAGEGFTKVALVSMRSGR